MPKSLEHYTAMARERDPEVRFAVPARNPEISSARTSWLMMLSTTLGPLSVLGGAFGARVVTRRDPAHRQALVRTILLSVGADRVTAHHVRRFGRRLGPAIESFPVDGLTYRSTDVMLETKLRIEGVDWLVHGWYERELRQALRSFGHADALEDV